MKKFQIGIVNGNATTEPEMVAIQAVPDLNPSQTVLDAVMGPLKRIPSFKQIATTPLPGGQLDLGVFKQHHHWSLLETIEHWIKREVLEIIELLEGDCKKKGGVSARAILPPDLFAKFTFSVDLTGAKPGDAHIWHVTQVNGQAQPRGGTTVVIAIL